MIELEEFIEGITEAVEAELETCEPDADVAPALFVFHGDGICELMMVGEFMNEEPYKAAFVARVLPATLKRFDAAYFALVNHRWHFDCEEVAIKDQFYAWARDHPEADWGDNPVWPMQEKLMIVFGSQDGTVATKSALLARREHDAPLLGEWTEARARWGESGLAQLDIGERMIDFGMEALTGKKLVSARGFATAARSISQQGGLRDIVREAWEALGYTEEEGMEKFAREGPASFAEVDAKMRELYPDLDDRLRTLLEEHLPDAAQEYISPYDLPDGMVLILNDRGEIEPVASFFHDEVWDDLLEEGE